MPSKTNPPCSNVRLPFSHFLLNRKRPSSESSLLICFFPPSLSRSYRYAMCTGLSILRFYSLPPDELFIKWETFLLNHLRPTKDGRPHEFSLEHARELRKEIQREAQAKGNAGAGGSGTPGGVGGGGKVRMGGIGGGGGNKRSSMGGGGLDL
jgi:hypothetical protein